MDAGRLLNPATIDMLRDLDDGSGFFVDLIAEYVTQSDRLLGEINVALAACDHRGARFAMHTLKGSSYNIGADQLGELCAAFERLDSDDTAGQTELLTDISQTYASSVAALHSAAAT